MKRLSRRAFVVSSRSLATKRNWCRSYCFSDSLTLQVEHVGCCVVQIPTSTLFECNELVLVQCVKALHEGSLLESEVNELQKKLAADVPVAWGEAAGENVGHKLTPS